MLSEGPQLATIDPATGNVTVLGPSQDGLDAIVFDCAGQDDDDDDDDDEKKKAPPAAADPVAVAPTFTG